MKTIHVALACALALLIVTGSVRAQTFSYAEAMTKLAEDCGSDVQKFCDGVNLGSGRLAECLQKSSAKIAPVCLKSLATVFGSVERREQAQGSYDKMCARDMARLCKGVKGDGHILACLNKAHSRIGADCNQAIVDAGWR